jgi:hypothetical protein
LGADLHRTLRFNATFRFMGDLRSLPFLQLHPRLFALLVHEARSESAFCLVLVMRPAQQAHVLDGRRSAIRHGDDVVVLQPLVRAASTPVVADERAAAAVPLPHFPSDMRRNASHPLIGAATALRSARTRHLALLELRDQSVQRAVEHPADLSSRNGVAQQGPRSLELLPRGGFHVEFHTDRGLGQSHGCDHHLLWGK